MEVSQVVPGARAVPGARPRRRAGRHASRDGSPRGVLLSIALVLFTLAYAVPVGLSMHPHPALIAAAVLLGVPALATATAVLQRPETPLDVLRLYLAELLDLGLELLTFPFIFIVIPLQAVSGLALFLGFGMVIGVLYCVVQNLFHLNLGATKDWREVGVLALFTLGLFAVSIPGMWLAQVAEERSISVYGWLRERAEAFHDEVQARLR